MEERLRGGLDVLADRELDARSRAEAAEARVAVLEEKLRAYDTPSSKTKRRRLEKSTS